MYVKEKQFGEGISKIGETLDFAVDLDIINKSGSWFSYNGERLGQGRENVKKVFEENEELYNEIYGLVRDEIMSKTGKKNNSVDEEESNDNIDELDLGIETLGEVEQQYMNKKLFKIVLWLMIFIILASGFISAIAIFL